MFSEIENNLYIKKYWVKYTEDKELIFKPIIRSYCTEDQDSHEPYSSLKNCFLKDDNDNYIKDPNNDKYLEECDEFLSQQEKTIWKKYIVNFDEIESIMTEYNETKTYYLNGKRKTLVDCFDLFLDIHSRFIPHFSLGYRTYVNSYFSDYCILIDNDKKEMTFVPIYDDYNNEEMLLIMDAIIETEKLESGEMQFEKIFVDEAIKYINYHYSNYKWNFKLKDREVEFKDYEQFELLHKYNIPEDKYVDVMVDCILNLSPVK